MTQREFTDEILVGFADGELDAATAAAVEAAMAEDAGLRRRVETFRATRTLLKARLGDVAREPVPDHLTQLVMAGGAPSAAAVRPASGIRAAMRRPALPLAAALACLVAGGIGYWSGTQRSPARGELSVAAAGPVLERLLAGGTDGATAGWRLGGRSGDVALRATYRSRGGLCRSFAVTETAAAAYGGLACLGQAGWQVRVVAAERDTGSTTPASGGGEAVDAYLDAVEAGEPLAEAEVGALIRSGWR